MKKFLTLISHITICAQVGLESLSLRLISSRRALRNRRPRSQANHLVKDRKATSVEQDIRLCSTTNRAFQWHKGDAVSYGYKDMALQHGLLNTVSTVDFKAWAGASCTQLPNWLGSLQLGHMDSGSLMSDDLPAISKHLYRVLSVPHSANEIIRASITRYYRHQRLIAWKVTHGLYYYYLLDALQLYTVTRRFSWAFALSDSSSLFSMASSKSHQVAIIRTHDPKKVDCISRLLV